MTTNDAVSLLKKAPLFSSCSKQELDAITRSAKEVKHRTGHVIAREGDVGVGFFLITDGTAEVTIGGKKRAALGPGDFFGEVSLLDRGPRTATVTATSPITMLGLTAWTFRGLIDQHPSIAMNMLKVVAQRLRAASGVTAS